jgi:hypothetical protein
MHDKCGYPALEAPMTKDEAERLMLQIERVCPQCDVHITHAYGGAYALLIGEPNTSEVMSMTTADDWWTYLNSHPIMRAHTV